MIKYTLPKSWISYDPIRIAGQLASANAAILSLTRIPYQKSWADKLQEIQFKREIAGTSRIEGADFTETELEKALAESPEDLITRSQKQAAAAKKAYEWIAKLPNDYPISSDLILTIHRLIVTGADDDHCEPGVIRKKDQNVTFGDPRHRGAEGGKECSTAFNGLINAINHEMKEHDSLVRALSVHYHLAAMHPFLDGNGRTARAMEALFVQRAGLRDVLFIAMSNYYYEEKNSYLKVLAEVRRKEFDLTPFLLFGLKGIEIQCNRLFEEIRRNISKTLFRDVMFRLYGRLKNTRKRVLADRQLKILNLLLDDVSFSRELYERMIPSYSELKNPDKALIRDIAQLFSLHAITYDSDSKRFSVNLDWPTTITETEFFEKLSNLPKAKTHDFFI